MSGAPIQKGVAEASVIKTCESGNRCHRRSNSNHNERRAYSRLGIRIGSSDAGGSKYPRLHGSITNHGDHRQTSQNRVGEEEIAMAGCAPATKKPKEHED
ncbi:hypothetical protein R1flu_018365 [Riccia fluitans]|uniref:Uncharacterized protein n=1 Tax=Riccia fluitans TaxID=41844 RepID=A0ABD1ZFL8_9MARC